MARIIKKIFLWFSGILLSLAILLSLLLYIFRDNIIQAAVSEINKYLNVKVNIDPDIDLTWWSTFPNVSVRFRDVRINESVPGSDSLMGRADNVYLAFHTWQLMQGEYVIQELSVDNAAFNLRVTKNGIQNFNIIKKDTSSSGGASSLDITGIHGHKILISYRDERDGQLYSIFSNQLQASLSVDSLRYRIFVESSNRIEQISVAGTSFLGGKLANTRGVIVYEPDAEKVTFEPSDIQLEDALFAMHGYVDLKKQQLDLKIDNKESEIKTLISLMPAKVYSTLRTYKSDGKIYLNCRFTGSYGPTKNPDIHVLFGLDQVNMQEPDRKIELRNITLKGEYSNGKRQNVSTSQLKLQGITAELDNKKIQGNFEVVNFSDPWIKFDVDGYFSIPWLMRVFPSDDFRDATGGIELDLNFEGKVSALRTQRIGEIKASGEIILDTISARPVSVPYNIERLSGTLLFNNSDIAVDDLFFTAGKSDFRCSGFLKNVLPRLVNGEKRMLADISVESSYIDVEELLKKDTLGKSGASVPEGKFPYLDPYILKIKLNAGLIHYKKVNLRRVEGAIRFDQPYLEGSRISFEMAGGKVAFDANTIFHSADEIQTSLKSTLTGLHIDSLFYMFDDFGQTFIVQRNLKGKFTGAVDAIIYFDKDGKINSSKLIANIDGGIKDGELIAFEPMQNLSKFIEARELGHLHFSELNNKVFIANRVITIPEMKIVSNVSTIGIAGTHSFDNDMDYQLAIPLRNLKTKINLQLAQGAVEEDQKQGTTVFLTIKGNSDNYKIAYDTKRTGKKIQEDLKKEKQEFIDLFKKQKEEIKTVKPDKNEYFEWQ